MNRFAAKFQWDIKILPVKDARRNGAAIVSDFEGRTLRSIDAAGRPSGMLAIRPEHLQVPLDMPAKGNAIPAPVTDLTHLGSDMRLSLETPGGHPLTLNITMVQLPDQNVAGARVWLGWSDTRGRFCDPPNQEKTVETGPEHSQRRASK